MEDRIWYWRNESELPGGLILQTLHQEGECIYCGSGGHVEWRIVDQSENVVESGTTCPCYNGCANFDDLHEVAAEFGGHL